MKRKRHPPEEIIKKLREAATLLAGGQSVEEVCKKLEVSPPTYHRWRQEYGGAKEETVKRLKKLVADLSLDKAMLKELVEGAERSETACRRQPEGQRRRVLGNMVGPARKREEVRHLEESLEVSERRACEVTAQPRATQRYRGRRRGAGRGAAAHLSGPSPSGTSHGDGAAAAGRDGDQRQAGAATLAAGGAQSAAPAAQAAAAW